jgi:hypothetical protein
VRRRLVMSRVVCCRFVQILLRCREHPANLARSACGTVARRFKVFAVCRELLMLLSAAHSDADGAEARKRALIDRQIGKPARIAIS